MENQPIPIPASVFISQLPSNEYKLKQQILVTFSKDEKELIGEVKELEIYSYGSSEKEIIEDIAFQIINLIEALLKYGDKLGAKPKAWKSYLNLVLEDSI